MSTSSPPRLPSFPSDPPPRIAVFSGPTATIEEVPPLRTSNKARDRHGLPPLLNPDGSRPIHDVVRPQRLAAPVTVYIEAFSAHPLESDAAELYAPPDGYVDATGAFSRERRSPSDVPVFEAVLRPEDGLLYLPYMARRRDGGPWDDEGLLPNSPPGHTRQPFYPDASRVFEEIDRFGLDPDGANNLLSSRAEYAFYRAAPSGGYRKGLPHHQRTDVGEGDIEPEVGGEDFFYYRPFHMAEDPAMPTLARLTNVIQAALASNHYDGAIWLEGTPAIEETAYWLNLLIDTTVPIVCTASQRPHGAAANDGDRNIIDSVDYIRSRIWCDANGCDGVGAVLVDSERIFTARDVQKADARPGGYVATGGHGGIVGTIGDPGPPMLTFWPAKAHTHRSAVNINQLPSMTHGVRGVAGRVESTAVCVKGGDGSLRAEAIPKVTIIKFVRYGMDDHTKDPDAEVEIAARIERNLGAFPLSGLVLEGKTPFGGSDGAQMAALRHAVLHGIPVVQTARGNAEGTVTRNAGGVFIAGNNLTATKARLLLMACLLRFGSPPPARDPHNPTASEWEAITQRVAEYQSVFNTH